MREPTVSLAHYRHRAFEARYGKRYVGRGKRERLRQWDRLLEMLPTAAPLEEADRLSANLSVATGGVGSLSTDEELASIATAHAKARANAEAKSEAMSAAVTSLIGSPSGKALRKALVDVDLADLAAKRLSGR